MKAISSVVRLGVELDLGKEAIAVGTLAWSRASRTAAFQYKPAFLQSKLQISPLRLQTRPEVIMAPRMPFDGLHGVFADSLPDGWGRILTDRRMMTLGRDPATLSPLDRLSIVGTRGMGALTFHPEDMADKGRDVDAVDLDWYRHEAHAIQNGSDGADIEALFRGNGGSAGARPKILVLRNRDDGVLTLDVGQVARPREDHWIVKFESTSDAVASGRVEYAFALMAQAAGLDVPETMLLSGPSKKAYFATRRFDRWDGRRVHIHTLAGMVQSDFRMPSLDYDDFLKVTRIVTGSMVDVAEAFRRMAFNILAGNRDDHDKNHAFAMAANGDWRLTPAYDLTPSDGPGGEHSLTVAGEGRRPGLSNMLKVAERASLRRDAVAEAIDMIEAAIARWPDFAAAAKMRPDDATRAAKSLELSASSALGKAVRVQMPAATKSRRLPKRAGNASSR